MTTRQPKTSQLSSEGSKLALVLFNHIESQVALAGTTAAVIVAVDSLLLGSYVLLFSQLNILNPIWRVIFALGGLVLVSALLVALVATYPNLRILSAKTKIPIKSVTFFAAIAAQDFDEFCKAFEASDSEHLLNYEVLHQVHGKALWLRRVFRWLQRAIILTALGTVLSIIVLIVNGVSIRP